MTPVIEINHLVRRYGRAEAVEDLNLRVQPGRCYGFFGRNGAGKTTTIKCLLNLLRPSKGQRTQLENHRSAERGAGRIWKQLLALSGCLAFAVATWLMAVKFA